MSPEETTQIDVAEYELRRLGLADVRVHHHGPIARLDAPARELAAIATGPLRTEVVRAVRIAGFEHVTLDLGAHGL
jgi:pyridinium-3,5-biscarboxylic acid mononucleotide sulfurtransferase